MEEILQGRGAVGSAASERARTASPRRCQAEEQWGEWLPEGENSMYRSPERFLTGTSARVLIRKDDPSEGAQPPAPLSRQAAAWIPVLTHTPRGGIFVLCTPTHRVLRPRPELRGFGGCSGHQIGQGHRARKGWREVSSPSGGPCRPWEDLRFFSARVY